MKRTELKAASGARGLLCVTLLGGLSAGLIVSPAVAADLPVKAPPMAPRVASWTQFYIGAGLGFDLVTGRSSVNPTGGNNVALDGLQGADLGLSAFVGADVQVSQHVVIGAFADYDWAHQNTQLSLNTFGQTVSATLPSLDRGWTIGGRVGFLVTPDTLLYGLAGYSEMKLNNWSAVAGFPDGSSLLLFQQPAYTSHGYTVGAGVEYRLADNVSLRSEYRYVNLGSVSTFDPLNNAIWTNDLSQHLVRISAAYRFGNFGTPAPAVSTTRLANPSWTGFYVGAGIGGDAVAPHLSGTLAGALDVNAAGLGGADVGGTAVVGYDRRIAPNWVVGAFGLVDVATNGGVKFTGSATGVAGVVSTDLAAVDWSWTVGGRIGYLVAPNTMVYALGGYSGITLHAVTYDIAGVTGTGPTPWYHGATFGGGFERFFTDTISARAEYRQTHVDTITNLSSPGWTNVSAGGTLHTVRATLSYHLPTL